MAGLEQLTTSAERRLRLIHWSSAASRQLRRQLGEVAASHDLTDNELLVLWLCRGGGRVQVDLAAGIGVSPAQMSGVVERLGARGLVAMHRPTIDRRRQVWQTSAAGQELLAAISPQLAELTASLLGSLSVAEQEQLESLCHRLADGTSGGRGSTSKSDSADHDDQRHVRQEAA